MLLNFAELKDFLDSKVIQYNNPKFIESEHLPRTQKHISDPLKNSAVKRYNMLIRINKAA